MCLELVPVFNAFILCAGGYVLCDLIQKCVDVEFITNLILRTPPSFSNIIVDSTVAMMSLKNSTDLTYLSRIFYVKINKSMVVLIR